MRILVLAALLGGGLCAQTPPVKPSEQAPEPQAATPVPTSNPAALDRRSSSPSTPMIVTANNWREQFLHAIIPSLRGRVALAPTQACAIPLLNVVPRGGFNGDPKIAIMGSQTLANIDHMPLIQGVPPCAQAEP